MKTSFKTFALVVAFFAAFTFNAFADEKDGKKATGFGTGIFASKSGKLHINVDKYADDNTVVLVSDKSGKLMFHEVLGKNVTKYRKTLDVADLPAGTYQIEITSKIRKEVKSFELTDVKAERSLSVK
ncbi:hypothetical protein [Dyadobacter luticola]|uniref:T9SS type A sorting domain-containing protein n=1 Tax=Dyadobacter luticola TaxID=1979387 RepID=A0A5R9KT93_9BACT|nr:hypothetical protein [Dyadobacter luticola]TLU99296.1 hypothetical protein FEN17_22280 [Dyadobacter luticola]